MTTKLLTQSQAEAVFSAMCALNNVSGRIDATFFADKNLVRVRECADSRISVELVGIHEVEYTDQATFATAYGLQQG